MEQIARCNFIITNIRGVWLVTDIFEELLSLYSDFFKINV